MNAYEKCCICPRNCNFDRTNSISPVCHSDCHLKIAHTMIHKWEEPCISGRNGSGAIFFSGCSLSCVYCQNSKISRSSIGKNISEDELIDIFYELKKNGADNINLVTMTHFTPTIANAIRKAKEKGFDLPFISNTSGYENVNTLKTLESLIDVYLCDFKYMDKAIAKRYSNAENYPEVAKKALEEMYRQQKEVKFNENGLISKGIIVRHLCLPGHTEDSKNIIRYVHETYGKNVYLSIMNQFTPLSDNLKGFEELNRRLTKREYDKVVDYAISIGVGEFEEAYIQENGTNKESFIPDFV